MFDNLSNRLDGIVKRLRGKGRLTEADVDEVMKEIRSALLEADVNVTVVRSVCNRIREHAIGATRSQALDPGQQVVKAVHDELISTLGGETIQIIFAPKPPTVVLMAGLQGAGKTTTTAKLARWFKQQGRNPLLVGADLQRPAAVEQLRKLGEQVGVPVFSEPTDPVEVARASLAEARDARDQEPVYRLDAGAAVGRRPPGAAPSARRLQRAAGRRFNSKIRHGDRNALQRNQGPSRRDRQPAPRDPAAGP